MTRTSKRMSVNQREVLSGLSTVSSVAEYLNSTSGALNVAVISGGGGGTQYQELATTTPATGTLALGRYSSSLPTLTNGQMNEPMLDSASRLIVNGSETTGSTVSGAGQLMSAQYQSSDSSLSTGQSQALRVNNQGKLWVYTNDNVQVYTNDNAGSANFTGSTQTNVQNTSGLTTAYISLTGTWSATVVFEIQTDATGSNWFAITGVNASNGALQSSATGNGNWVIDVSGAYQVRARCSAYVSGTVVCYIRAGAGAGATQLVSPIPPGSNSIGNVGAATATQASIPADAFYQGGMASTALPTATTATDLVGAMYDKFGRQVVIPQAPRDLIGFQTTTFTASTASATVITGASNIFSDITSIALVNSGASATIFTLSDGTNSYTFYVPVGDMRGAVYQVPLAATTVDTNWTGQCTTSTSSVYCTITYIKNR